MSLRHASNKSTGRSFAQLVAVRAAAVETLESRQLLSATLSGHVFNDLMVNGKAGANPGVAGVQVFIDANNNGAYDSGELTATTNAHGAWKITGLNAGTYSVIEQTPSDWASTTATSQVIHLKHSMTSKAFGLTQKAVVTGTVFNDVNSDGSQDDKEHGLAGQQIYNDANDNGQHDKNEKAVQTSAKGTYRIVVSAGVVQMSLVQNKQYSPIMPLDGHQTLTLAMGQTLTLQNFATHKGKTSAGGSTGSTTGGTTSGTTSGTTAGSTSGSTSGSTGGTKTGSTSGTKTGSTGGTTGGTKTGSTGGSKTGSTGGTTGGTKGGTTGGTGGSKGGTTGGTTGGTSGGSTGGSTGGKTASTGDYTVTSTRASYAAKPGYDIVKIYAFDSATGQLVGSNGHIFAEEGTLSSAAGLIIRADPDSGMADLDGSMFGYSASYIGLGVGSFLVTSNPNESATTYTDYQSLPQFSVTSGKIGGAIANTGIGLKVAVAVVRHSAAVTLTLSLVADVGPTETFTYTA